jgi:hypothetical protein
MAKAFNGVEVCFTRTAYADGGYDTWQVDLACNGNHDNLTLGFAQSKAEARAEAVLTLQEALRQLTKPMRPRVHCPRCAKGRAKRLPLRRVTQGPYGNCAACWRQLRKVPLG